MPALSLCLIVRDEEAMLPDLLAATAGLRDELIAVDTGSTDRTREILAAAGATILDHAWTDDFSAARNVGLEQATGDWILVFDADERPSAELIDQIRAILADATVGAATIRMHMPLPHGQAREADVLRLWRRDPAIRYRHRIHEDPGESVQAYLTQHGLRLVNLSGRCEHLGYARDLATARGKKERDRRLLTAAVTDEPDDWYSWCKLMELARFWGDRALWRETAEAVVARLDGPPPVALPPHAWAGELVALSAAGRFDGPAEQAAWLDRWEERIRPVPAFYLQRGLARERTGDLDRAEADFQRCRDLPAGTLPANSTVRPLLGLCRLAAQRGDLLTAGDLVHQALTEYPRDPEALLAAVSFAWLNGGAEARDAFVSEHRQLHGDSVELALTLGEHALQAGLWADAESALAPVAGSPPRGRVAELLAQSWLARGEVDRARDLCRDLMADHAPAGMGYLTCCLVAGEPADFSVDLEQEDADTAFKEWIAVLWRSRQADLMTTFVDGYALVAEIFPWLPAYLTEQTERLKSVSP
jgi:tetratricopeptide (TPR) repeat protein